MSNTLKHIEALQSAAIDLESQLRANGFTRDCDRVSDAVRRGMKSGFAFLVGEDGEPEIIPLGEKSGKVEVEKGKEPGHYAVTYGEGFETWNNTPARTEKQRSESERIMHEGNASYKAMAGEEFSKAAARSHEPGNRTEGKFPPQVHEGARTLAKPTGDAARRAQMTADAKAFTASQFERNRRIAEAQKARSREIHR